MRKFAIVLTSLTSLGVVASAQAQGPSVGDVALRHPWLGGLKAPPSAVASQAQN